ncbi:MAG: hypothetical protein ACI92I_000466 [Acidimicrobiales bacterium]|jgi:hypothetical protein
MNFEQPAQIPADFVSDAERKIEKGLVLDLPITEEELNERCEGDTNCETALEALLEYSTRYAADVWNMKQLLTQRSEYSDEEWKELFARADDDRTRLHNTLIDSIGILSRALTKAGEDNQWVKELAPNGKLERARCGKFAIMLCYSKYVNS